MGRWAWQWSTPFCTCCGQQETLQHVHTCPTATRRATMSTQTSSMVRLLPCTHTAPHLLEPLTSLLLWTPDTPLMQGHPDPIIKEALFHQQRIGWQRTQAGLLLRTWGEIKQKLLDLGNTRSSADLWTKLIIRSLWNGNVALWQTRNGRIHRKQWDGIKLSSHHQINNTLSLLY